MDVHDWIGRVNSLLTHRETIKWELGDAMIEGQSLGEEASQALPASESVMHMLRIYAECAELWPQDERNPSVQWVHHYVLRHHPKRAAWLAACVEQDIQCDRVLRDLLNR